MLKAWLRLMPFFIVERLARKHCERIPMPDGHSGFIAFRDVVLVYIKR